MKEHSAILLIFILPPGASNVMLPQAHCWLAVCLPQSDPDEENYGLEALKIM